MSSTSIPSVLIAGAGPTGLTLALSLLQNGVSVRIIDKLPYYRKGTRGAGITPRTMEIFSRLGVHETDKQAVPALPVAIYMPDGVTIKESFDMAPYNAPTPACPFSNSKLLGQSHSEEILRAALEKYSCSVELDTELVSFEQTADEVTAHILKRQNGQEMAETVKYAFLVGTDGGHGVTRKCLGLTFLGESRDSEHAVVGDVYVEGLDSDHWHMWGAMSSGFATLRRTEYPGLFNFAIMGPDIPHAELVSDRETLLSAFRKIMGREDLKFGEVTWVSHFSPNIRMVNKFGEGRVFVAGDAAHVHSPTGGQGMNSGVLDANNLGWKIALVSKGLASPKLLETYTEERLPVIEDMLKKTTVLLNKTFGNGGGAATGKGAGKAEDGNGSGKGKPEDRSAWKRGGALLQLGVNSRWSSIVVDEQSAIEDEPRDPYGPSKDGKLHAGDRAPDAPGLVDLKAKATDGETTTTSLFSIFAPSYHTVLIFADAADQSLPILSALESSSFPAEIVRSVVIRTAPALVDVNVDVEKAADFILEDRQRHAHDAYHLSDGCYVAIVRPDGVVGAVVRGREGLERYFKGVFSV